MSNEQRFDDWFADRIWGNEDFKTCLRLAWNAALAQQVPADGEVKAWLIRADNGMAIKCVMSEQERDALLFRGESSQFPEWTATPLVEAATPQAPQPVVDDPFLAIEHAASNLPRGYAFADAVEHAEPASQPQQGAVDAFDAGWRMAAAWAYRDDLLADMDSSAYKTERGAALAAHGKGG